jgi:UDP-N-acetylglucosamine 2-epimerase (non-hydrolysing)
MACAKKILADSAGIQKVAYLLGVPCITLRDTTEWVETVRDGGHVLVGADREKIVDAVKHFSPSGKRSMVFGEVGAAGRIAGVIGEFGGL